MARAGPKIFDKVRAFEERRASVELPGRASSFDSDDSGKRAGGLSKEEGRLLQGVAEKRAAFKQRASSLEDKTSYTQRVQSYQSKFTEELQRIKKLVGKPSLKKSYSTEQLSQTERQTSGKVEPIPRQVVEKLEARERALEGAKAWEVQNTQQAKDLRNQGNPKEMTQPNLPVDISSRGGIGKISVTMETAPDNQLPGQPLPTASRTILTRFGKHHAHS